MARWVQSSCVGILHIFTLAACVPVAVAENGKEASLGSKGAAKVHRGNCVNGTSLAESERTQDGECGSCDQGYVLEGKKCRPYEGNCKHGTSVSPQSKRTADNQCAGCDDGFYLEGKKCRPYGGTCKNGKLVSQNQRTQDNHCGVCDAGYQRKDKTCQAFAGKCANGSLIFPQSQRTEDNQCGSCDKGYDLESKRCRPFGGTCTNGKLASQSERTQDNHCAVCDPGYDHYHKQCRPYGGKCRNGTLVFPQSKRTADNQCGSCDKGFALESNKKCRLYGGKCKHGNLIFPESKRDADDQCGTCDPGYVLPQGAKQCRPYGGKCINGKLISQSNRTMDDQCGSCNDGFALRSNSCEVCAAGTYSNSGKECEPCPGCKWSTKGASECNTCDYVLHAIDIGDFSDCDVLPSHDQTCPFNPFIHLANKTNLSSWHNIVQWLQQNEFDVDMEDPTNTDRTPVVAAVEHCNESSVQRGQMMQTFVSELKADTITGLPLVKAEKCGCDEKWWTFLATHAQGLSLGEKWDRLSSSSRCYKSVAIGCLGGLFIGVFLHLSRETSKPEDRSRGALRLAALALYPFRLRCLHMCMCYLAVIANIMWMFHIGMAAVHKWLFLFVFAGFVWIPAVCIQCCVQSSRKLDRPSLVALPLAYDPRKRKAALGFHMFTVVRFFIFFLLHSLVDGKTKNFQQVKDVTVFPNPQLYHVKALLSNSFLSKSGQWFENEDTRLYRNPFHLPRSGVFPPGIGLKLPLRQIFYTFGGVVEVLSLLWCVMTVCVVLWPSCKQKRIDTDEQKESENNLLEELANKIEQAAAQGHDLRELRVEREFKESSPSQLNERWTSSYQPLSQPSGDDVEVKHVQPVSTWGLYSDLLFIAFDLFTDVWQITNMYLDEFYIFGGALLSVFISSLFAQICGREFLNVRQEFNESLSKGFRTNNFLRILDREKGFEAFMSLSLSCYAVYWQVNIESCIPSLVSIICSGWGVASYLFNNVFLEEHAADHIEQGWRLPREPAV